MSLSLRQAGVPFPGRSRRVDPVPLACRPDAVLRSGEPGRLCPLEHPGERLPGRLIGGISAVAARVLAAPDQVGGVDWAKKVPSEVPHRNHVCRHHFFDVRARLGRRSCAPQHRLHRKYERREGCAIFRLVSGKPLEEPNAWYGPIVTNTQDQLREAFNEFQKGAVIPSPVGPPVFP